jgi:hypothetical protein
LTRSIRSWVALLALGSLPACGYSSGLRVTETHRTIGVEVFGNTSFERDLERLFYDEMARAVRDTCDAELVDPSRAELVIRGEIQSYRRRSGIRSQENKLLETGVYIQVQAALYERGAPEPTSPPATAQQWVGYIIDGPQNERDARDRALHNIADELVLELFVPVN